MLPKGTLLVFSALSSPAIASPYFDQKLEKILKVKKTAFASACDVFYSPALCLTSDA